MGTNRSVRIHGKHDVRIEDLPIPEPQENWVQLRMSTVGICRTDVHLYDEGRVDHIVINKPITIGHEISGTVSKLGKGVTNLEVGDRVAVDPCRACGNCHQCNRGRSNICRNLHCCGVLHADGGFANYMVTPANTCYKLPENMSFEEGAMMEPLSVGVNGVKRAGMMEGDVVVVMGAGPIGLFAMQSAKALGAARVMMVDINPSRLDLASKMGASLVFKPTLSLSDPKAASEELKAALGDEADLCIECSGAPGTVDLAIHVCRPGGKVMMLGFGEMAMNVHVGMAAVREIDILGAFANLNNYPECIRLVSEGKIDVRSAITHRLPLDKVKQGMDLVRSGQSVKVVVDCGGC
ncbi:sorbitol dehydrogenase [Plakobranchus ocellatus]|uniref:Sorbitol dehydrogenase n=1 Tax=Plakobranchus ocellatus TaxID=259542 RepID=A0AAV4BPA7_9GAST|nr:sorbitol dehydrogenase [Plakobranchus ocellatus]